MAMGHPPFEEVLLMEEILHHPGCIKFRKEWDIYLAPYELVSWISSINRISLCENDCHDSFQRDKGIHRPQAPESIGRPDAEEGDKKMEEDRGYTTQGIFEDDVPFPV